MLSSMARVGLPFVDLALGGLGAAARNERAAAREAPGRIEHRALAWCQIGISRARAPFAHDALIRNRSSRSAERQAR